MNTITCMKSRIFYSFIMFYIYCIPIQNNCLLMLRNNEKYNFKYLKIKIFIGK